MKKIISFSLWGDKPKYCIGAIKNLELAKIFYKDWFVRFYIGNDVPKNIISILEENGAEIIYKNGNNWTGMFWRFEPASENIICMISRDVDSRLSEREFEAVSEWLNSEKEFHIMRDHPFHGVPILGGMWGAKHNCIPDMKEKIKKYTKGNFWQVDQNFLKEIIYPEIKNRSLVHDPFFEKKPFPSERKNLYDFVGQVYNEHDTPEFTI